MDDDYDAPLGPSSLTSMSATPTMSTAPSSTAASILAGPSTMQRVEASQLAIGRVTEDGIILNASIWTSLSDEHKEQIRELLKSKRIRFNELFSGKRSAYDLEALRKKKARADRVVKVEEYSTASDEAEAFWAGTDPQRRPHGIRLPTRAVSEASLSSTRTTSRASSSRAPADAPLMLSEWERHIVWEPHEESPRQFSLGELAVRLDDLKDDHEKNLSVADEPWEAAIVWDADQPPPEALTAPLIMDHNDPYMLWEEADAAIPDEPHDMFNLSNDHFYESKKRQERVRHGVGKVVLRHSLPAVRVEYPLYKTFLTKDEARQLHRTPLHFVPRMAMPLLPPKALGSKKLKKMARNDDVVIQSQKELTLKDDCNFFLFEYSEEYPPLLSKPGMATLINNYYRKRDENDTTIPEREIGNPVVLEPLDQSPLAIFADVPPGQTLTCLYNNLFRAPIFPHAPRPTDFLVVKHRGRYFLRAIPNLYVVGQTFPLTEVPTPNSRKAHIYVKNRIEAFVAREFTRKDNPDRRLRVDDVFAAFPFLAEANVRKKLRTVADARAPRAGAEATHWQLRDPHKLLTEEQCRKRVPPEAVCAYESMVSAQQLLRDAGYRSQLAMEQEDDDEDTLQVDDEVKLAPWRVSKNVINAFQGKGMMQITGTGDPTGRGEGFSFIRVPSRVTVRQENAIPRSQSVAGTDSDLRKMSVEKAKEILAGFGVSEEEMKIGRWKLIGLVRQYSSSQYLHGGEGDIRYARHLRASTAEQQRGYRQEINRIWQSQWDALSSAADIPSDEEDEAPEQAPTPAADHLLARLGTPGRAASPSPAPPSETASVRPRALKIERRVRLPDGRHVWRSEVVEDERVIEIYLAERKAREARAEVMGPPPSTLKLAASSPATPAAASVSRPSSVPPKSKTPQTPVIPVKLKLSLGPSPAATSAPSSPEPSSPDTPPHITTPAPQWVEPKIEPKLEPFELGAAVVSQPATPPVAPTTPAPQPTQQPSPQPQPPAKPSTQSLVLKFKF